MPPTETTDAPEAIADAPTGEAVAAAAGVPDAIGEPSPPMPDQDGAFMGLPEPGRYKNLFKGVLLCTGFSEELDGDDIVTAVGFKHSSHEDGVRITIKIKASEDGAAFLRRRFKTKGHYGLIVREAPIAPNGMSTNLKLDGELASILVDCAEIGKGVPIRKDGDAVSIVKFFLTDIDGGHGAIYNARFQFTVEGIYTGDNFELQNTYRLAITPPPDYVLEAEKLKANRFEDSPLGKAIASATGASAATGLGPNAKAMLAADGLSGTLTMPDGTERELTGEELTNLRKNLGDLVEGGLTALTPGEYKVAEDGQLTKDGQVVSKPGAGTPAPVDRKVKKKREPGASLASLYAPAAGATDDAIALESGRVIGFVTDANLRGVAEEQAIRIEEPTDEKPYRTYIVPPRGPLPGQYKDESDTPDDPTPAGVKQAKAAKK